MINLEKLLKEQKIIHALALRHNGNMVRICKDVRLKGRKELYFAHELDTAAINNPLNRGITGYDNMKNSVTFLELMD